MILGDLKKLIIEYGVAMHKSILLSGCASCSTNCMASSCNYGCSYSCATQCSNACTSKITSI